jgi:diguanylate cyclase (GGDEF)-like protein
MRREAPITEQIQTTYHRAAHRLAGLFALHRSLQALVVAVASALAILATLKLLDPTMFYDDHGQAVYWPVNAVVVAMMLMAPRRYWPWILLGSSIGQGYDQRSDHFGNVLAGVVGNIAEPLLAAWILPPFKGLADWMKQPRLVLRFTLGAVLFAPALPSAGFGLFKHLVYHQSFWYSAVAWDTADTLGMALWLPLILILLSRETYDLFRLPSLLRTLALLGLICALSWGIFHYSTFSIAFVILPVLLLVVFQIGFSGSVLAVNLVAIIVSQAVLRGHGSFGNIPPAYEPYRIAILQLFLMMSMFMSLPVSVLLLQRREFELELKNAYRLMEVAATEDGLTGVANRRRFDYVIETEWRRVRREGQSIALLMIDVDFFKLYNDAFGHLAGDQCLRLVVAAISSVPLRPADLVARFGGEEFAVLLPGADAQGATRVAELIRAKVASIALEHSASPLGFMTVSIGCAAVEPRPASEHFLLIENADRALYAAKQGGRNAIRLMAPSEVSTLEPSAGVDTEIIPATQRV